jgi:hypothetical protein
MTNGGRETSSSSRAAVDIKTVWMKEERWGEEVEE